VGVEFKTEAMNHADTTGSRRTGTVLVVDDDEDELRLTQRVVAAVCPHLIIKSVRSGAELIKYVKGERGFSDRAEFPYPGLILLDLRMPGMHGFEVLMWLTTHPPHNGIPAVVLTGSGEVLVAQQAYALGARSFLSKPLKPAELQHMMDTLGQFENQRELRPALAGPALQGPPA
jgi:CheY-like chemotaxis protein